MITAAARLRDVCELSLQIRPASDNFTADFAAVRTATSASPQR